jgi:hypothetical protein
MLNQHLLNPSVTNHAPAIRTMGSLPIRQYDMAAFKIVHLDLSTGKRTWLPWTFSNQAEAHEKITELTAHDPKHSYIVMLAPLGAVS